MTGPNSVFNQTQFQVAPTRFIARSLGETVIKVSNLDNVLFENVAPVTVTDFASAAPGQIISILGDGQTTIDNNTRIVTNTGADLLLDADRVYQFVFLDGIWYQIGTAGGGGGGIADGNYVDVTVSGGGTVITINTAVVTYAKIQDVSSGDRLLGRISGSGDVEEIVCTTAGRALLDDADATAQRTTLGLGTAALNNTGDFDAAGTAAAAVANRVVGPASATDDAIATYDGTTGKLIQNTNLAITIPLGGIVRLGPTSTDQFELNSTNTSGFALKLMHNGSRRLTVRGDINAIDIESTLNIATGFALVLQGTSTISVGTGTSAFDGLVLFNANVDLGNSGADLITVNGVVDSDIIPSGARSLGSSGARWTGYFNDLDANARVAVNKNSGATVGTRRRINFIEGSNVTLTITDDAGNEEVDVTIAASGGGGGISLDDALALGILFS